MRDVDQSAKDPEVDAPPRDTRGAGAAAPKGAAKRKAASAAAAQASVQHSTEAAPWFSGAGLRRRISLYHDQDTSEDRGEQEAATGAGRRRRRRHEAAAPSFAWVAGAASAAAALLIVGVPLAIMSLGGGRTAALLQAGGAPGASRYLRDLAALYDRTAGGGAPPEPAGGLTATMAGCAARAGPLPPVTLLPPRGPPARAPTPAEDPLRALDLDCGAPGGEEACARVVQRTNSYEGAAAAASEDLVGYLSAWEAYAAAQAAAKREALAGAHVPSDLDSLALDCDADPAPAACDGAAAASNSYEGDTSAAGAASAAAAEAQAYLDSLAQARRGGRMVGHVASAPQGPDGSASIDALALDCEADAAACAAAQAGSNAYERAESAQERARIAEEAASAYQGADSLALDCSGDAGSAPACARARASGGVYERTESRIERARIAEEASPASLGVDALSLDCWGPNGDGTGVDAAVAAECARSRAANNYELKPAHGHSHGHGHGHSHGEQPELQIGADGLPIGGPVQGYYSWIADVEGVNDAEVAAHAATYQAGGRAARGAGYDAPAFEADPVAAALARRGGARRRAATRAPDAAAEGPEAAGDDYEAEARAHADSYEAAYAKGDSAAREAGAYDVEAVERRRMQAAQQKVQEQSAGQERAYFKNPCNDPSLRLVYKNPANSPQHQSARTYYKNPANAPAFSPSKGAAPAAAPAATASLGAAIVSFWQGQPHVLAAIVAGLVGAAALTLLQGSGSNRRRSARASQDEASLAGATPAEVEPLQPLSAGGDLDDSPRKAGRPASAFASSPSPRKAGGGPVPAALPRLQAAEGGDCDVVRSGAADSPRRAGTPLAARSTTPLGGGGERP